MNKSFSVILTLVFAAATLVSVVLLPVAEFGSVDNIPSWLITMIGKDTIAHLLSAVKHLAPITDNWQYYAYALVLALALVASAVALSLVGRDESADEKTILPAKK